MYKRYAAMNYDKFLSEYQSFDSWCNDSKKNEGILGGYGEDILSFNDKVIRHPFGVSDSVNSPAHYTRGKVEAIEVIEDCVQDAPSPVLGVLHGQVIKYLLRLWLKTNPLEDAKKARWYLDRLITTLEKDY